MDAGSLYILHMIGVAQLYFCHMVIRTEKVILKRMRKFLQTIREENESRIQHNSKFLNHHERFQAILLPEPCMYSYEVFFEYMDPNKRPNVQCTIDGMKTWLKKANPTDVRNAWDSILVLDIMET